MKKILLSFVFALMLIAFNINTMQAKVYYNSVSGYYPAQRVVYVPVNYRHHNRYNRHEYYQKQRVKRAITYSAIGAGAGYLLSGENKGRNALIGAGAGGALGYFLHK